MNRSLRSFITDRAVSSLAGARSTRVRKQHTRLPTSRGLYSYLCAFMAPLIFLNSSLVFAQTMAGPPTPPHMKYEMKNVFFVHKKIKGTEADRDLLERGDISSVEARFYLHETRKRGNTYFVLLHHDALAKKEQVLCSLNFDDYQMTQRRLHKSYKKLWAKYILARDAGAAGLTGATLFSGYLVFKALASEKGKSLKLIEKLYASEYSPLRVAAAGSRMWINGHKGIQGAFLVLSEVALAYWLFDNYSKKLNKWVFRTDHAQRDWLWNAISQSQDNAINGTPIDTKVFDVESKIELLTKYLTGKMADAVKSYEEQEAEKAAEASKPAVTTVPVHELDFAVDAFKTYCKKYVEDNIEVELENDDDDDFDSSNKPK